MLAAEMRALTIQTPSYHWWVWSTVHAATMSRDTQGCHQTSCRATASSLHSDDDSRRRDVELCAKMDQRNCHCIMGFGGAHQVESVLRMPWSSLRRSGLVPSSTASHSQNSIPCRMSPDASDWLSACAQGQTALEGFTGLTATVNGCQSMGKQVRQKVTINDPVNNGSTERLSSIASMAASLGCKLATPVCRASCSDLQTK